MPWVGVPLHGAPPSGNSLPRWPVWPHVTDWGSGRPAGGQFAECPGSASQPGLAAGPGRGAWVPASPFSRARCDFYQGTKRAGQLLPCEKGAVPEPDEPAEPRLGGRAGSPAHPPRSTGPGARSGGRGCCFQPNWGEQEGGILRLPPPKQDPESTAPLPGPPARLRAQGLLHVLWETQRGSDPLTFAPSHPALGLGSQVREQRAALWKVTLRR